METIFLGDTALATNRPPWLPCLPGRRPVLMLYVIGRSAGGGWPCAFCLCLSALPAPRCCCPSIREPPPISPLPCRPDTQPRPPKSETPEGTPRPLCHLCSVGTRPSYFRLSRFFPRKDPGSRPPLPFSPKKFLKPKIRPGRRSALGRLGMVTAAPGRVVRLPLTLSWIPPSVAVAGL